MSKTLNLRKLLVKILQQLPRDTGWKVASMNSSFTAYGDGMTPKYRRIGNVVYVRGAVKPTSATAADSTIYIIFNLPLGYRPAQRFGTDSDAAVNTVCQGSTQYIWTCRVFDNDYSIFDNGNVTFSRYRNGSSYASASISAWLPFNFSFITDDDWPSS